MINGVPIKLLIEECNEKYKGKDVEIKPGRKDEVSDEDAFRLIEEVCSEIDKVNEEIPDEDAFRLIEDILNDEEKLNKFKESMKEKDKKLIFKVVYPKK